MTEAVQDPPVYRKSGSTGELASGIVIRADPGRIWAILMDLPQYPVWNPFIRQIRGTLAPGERITASLLPAGRAGMTIRPVIIRVEPERELRWRGSLIVPGLFDGEHVFGILPRGDGTCLFTQHEYFSGLLLPLFEHLMMAGTARGFQEMNRALKARAEPPGGHDGMNLP
jgi:hypothetical protein